LTDQHIIFKNSKTGKVEQITASELDIVNWQKLVGTWGIRIFLKNGTLHRFGGFKDGVSTFKLELHLCVSFVVGE
jgi:structure-specific recognition protein 1